MQLFKYLFLASLGAQISDVAGLIAQPPGVHATFFDKRGVTAPKPFPKPIEDPAAPREGGNPGSPGSSSGDTINSGGTETSHRSTAEERFLRIKDSSQPGYLQVLTPDQYIARGRDVLEQSLAAFKRVPRKDAEYDHWGLRYKITYDSKVTEGNPESGTNPVQDLEKSGAILKEVLSGLEVRGEKVNGDKQWSERGYTSKAPEYEGKHPDDVEQVAFMYIDKESGTVIATDVNSMVDLCWNAALLRARVKRLYFLLHPL